MKIILPVIALVLNLSAYARPVIGGRNLFTQLDLTCSFFDNKTKNLNVTVLGKHKEGAPSLAKFVINKVDSDGNEQAIEKFSMDYVGKEDGLILVYQFANKEEGLEFESMTDGMPRNGTLTIKRRSFDLTCEAQ